MTKTIKKSGFTLIELLIVIGLLAALAAVLLPSLMGDRDAAFNSVDKYNQAGTLRTLRQYEAMTGQLPNGFHTGLTQDATPKLMPGVSTQFKANVNNASAEGGIDQLSANEANALGKIGINLLAYGTAKDESHDLDDLGYQAVEEDLYVINVGEGWKDSNGKELSFNAKPVHYFEHEGYTKIIALFIAPTLQWDAEGRDWVKGFSVGMDIPATSPIPKDDTTFPYYIAYVGIQSGYKATVTEGANYLTAHLPPPNQSEDDLVTAIKALSITTPTDYNAISWGNLSDGILTGTFAYNGGGAGEAITITISIDYMEPTAKLLGTSNPDCVVTNP
jgi:prepilin-type N-terminal cleavage/methylation domain-containing protein